PRTSRSSIASATATSRCTRRNASGRPAASPITRTTAPITTSWTTTSRRRSSRHASGSRRWRPRSGGVAASPPPPPPPSRPHPLTVQSVPQHHPGLLLAIRGGDQNRAPLTPPKPASRDDVLVLRGASAGRLPPQAPDREVLALEGQPPENPIVTPEPRFVFSN